MKKISILGSTGSIGQQTLQVIEAFPQNFKVEALAAKDEVELIIQQIEKFKPSLVAVENEEIKAKIENVIATPTCRGKQSPNDNEIASSQAPRNDITRTVIKCGPEGLREVACYKNSNLLVVAIPGFTALPYVFEAIKEKKDIALATKEILVAAGNLFMEEIKKHGIKVFPIDSEHSAIQQCLNGEDLKNIKRIILTASGGPFYNTPFEEFKNITKERALNHPTWKMGPKITIDSATLMNKGFEVMEAHHLFNLPYEKIDVIIHPQSIIHSMVEFIDGAIIAQMGAPDMCTPIQYALFEGQRKLSNFERLDFEKLSGLFFRKPDFERFPCLKYAYEAGKSGGIAGVVLNAANDWAVAQFLQEKIKFTDIPLQIKKSLDKCHILPNPSLNDILFAQQNYQP